MPTPKKKPDWTEIAMAYDEAAKHLERAAAEPIDDEEKEAFRIVAKRIRAAGNRVRPTTSPGNFGPLQSLGVPVQGIKL